MSKMFDYISGKKSGKTAELEAMLEHHRAAVIEECARMAEQCGFETKDYTTADIIAAAIRALKDKQCLWGDYISGKKSGKTAAAAIRALKDKP